MTDILPDTDADHDADAVFVQEFVRSGDAVTACVVAGLRDPRYDIRVYAERTLARPEIRNAIDALQRIYKADATTADITLESVVADMQTVYQQALAANQFPSAIAAKKLQAQMKGWLDQKIEITHRTRPEEMSTAQLERLAKGYLQTNSVPGQADPSQGIGHLARISGPVEGVDFIDGEN